MLILNLRNEEVDVESFKSFTDDILLKNFSGLTFGQRRELMKLSDLLKAEYEKIKSMFGLDDDSSAIKSRCSKMAAENIQCTRTKDPTGLAHTEDLGCQPLSNADDDTEMTKHATDLFCLDLCTPSLSQSFSLNKPSTAQSRPVKKAKTTLDCKAINVEPMDIIGLLDCDRGKRLIASVRELKALSNSDQIFLMDRIYAAVSKDRESPFKHYPETSVKIAIAKGITKDFPELKCDGECEWKSWLTVTQTKFQSVRRKCGQRKNSSFSTGSQSQNTSRKRKTSTAETSTVTSRATCSTVEQPVSAESSTSEERNDELSILTASLKRYMDGALPNTQNRSQISASLASTYEARRSWINSEEPSCTTVLHEYKHLQSYNGSMILEEFSRMQPLEENFVEKFEKLAPLIVKHTQMTKPSLHNDVFHKFGHNVNLVALLVLPKLLPTSLNAKTASDKELAHLKKYKQMSEQIPSSSFLQVAPEGTDAFNHKSMESAIGKEEPTPIFPYLLWLTNDYKSGQIFLKIDQVSFLVGTFPSTTDPVIRAVEQKALFKTSLT
ncbi:putative M18 family aminopeptidase 2 [Frankliniella fusca]|uniref:M18 family aminopeptidase 2 n=1 Tax=Frankliniella fusca TaxID=407009 RepID=A0AAE1LMX8_9NEOP|nr:putative M18 family aminopeptidase 2 [Frankliniella fusca]